MATVTFGTKMSVKDFLASKNISKGNKVFFNYMKKKGTSEDAFYNDESGKETTIKKMAVQDEVGNTIAYVASKVAAELQEGKKPENLQFVETTIESVNPETAEIQQVTSWTLCHTNLNNVIDATDILGL